MVVENRRCHNFAPFLRLKTGSISEIGIYRQVAGVQSLADSYLSSDCPVSVSVQKRYIVLKPSKQQETTKVFRVSEVADNARLLRSYGVRGGSFCTLGLFVPEYPYGIDFGYVSRGKIASENRNSYE